MAMVSYIAKQLNRLLQKNDWPRAASINNRSGTFVQKFIRAEAASQFGLILRPHTVPCSYGQKPLRLCRNR